MRWLAFGALWLASWRVALFVTLASGLVWAVCRVGVERSMRQERKARRRTRRVQSVTAFQAVRQIGPVGYGLHPKLHGTAFVVYRGQTPRPLVQSWTVTPAEERRAELARWS